MSGAFRLLPSSMFVGDTLSVQFPHVSRLDLGVGPVVMLIVKTDAGIVREIAGRLDDDANEWSVTAGALETREWAAGTATYQVRLSSASGDVAETVDSDILVIEDPASVALDPDEAALKVMLGFRLYRYKNHQSTMAYSIGGRYVQMMSLKELDDAIERLRNVIAHKRNHGRFIQHRVLNSRRRRF